MPNFSLSMLLLVLPIFCDYGGVESAHHNNSNANINKLCKKTSYPQLCIQYLSIFPDSVKEDPKKIAKAGLMVSLNRVQQARSYIKEASRKVEKRGEKEVMKIKDYAVVQDCLEVFSDALSSICQSIIELDRMSTEGKAGVFDIQNYMSAALSDASTCVDEFDELSRKHLGKVMATIKAKALNAEQATSNGLDLFCQVEKCVN